MNNAVNEMAISARGRYWAVTPDSSGSDPFRYSATPDRRAFRLDTHLFGNEFLINKAHNRALESKVEPSVKTSLGKASDYAKPYLKARGEILKALKTAELSDAGIGCTDKRMSISRLATARDWPNL